MTNKIVLTSFGGTNLPKCPLCQTESNEVVREWKYSRFVVKSVYCKECNLRFQAYYLKNELSHVISNHYPKIRYKTKKQGNLHRKIVSYLLITKLQEKEIADRLGIKEVDVINALMELERVITNTFRK